MSEHPPLAAPLRLGLTLILVLVALTVHGGGLFGEYLYDDGLLIQANPAVQSIGAALSGWWDLLWEFESSSQKHRSGYWRPLTVLALAVGRQISGGEPWGIHGLSILLHVLASLAAMGVARRILRHDLGAWLVGMLFAVHPLHVQSVAWASAINDPLYGLLSLLSLGAFLRWREDGKGLPWLASIWLALALVAKEQALVVVPMALALECCLPSASASGTRSSRLLRAALSLGLVLGLWLSARAVLLGGIGQAFGGSAVNFYFDPLRQAALRVEILGGLLGLIFLPNDLAFFRGVQPDLAWSDPGVLVPLAWIGAVLGGLFLALVIHSRKMVVGLVLLVIPLLPNALLPEAAGAYPVADRFAYLAIFGAGLAATALVLALPLRNLGLAALTLACVPFGLSSIEQTKVYTDEHTFFLTAVEESPDVPAVYWSLGRVLLERFQRDANKEDLDAALYRYLQCLMLGHDYGDRSPKLGPEAPLGERVRELEGIVHSMDSKPIPDDSVMVSVEDRLQANLGQGWCLLLAGQLPPDRDLDTPLEIFSKVAERFPQSSDAAAGLGTIHLVRREWEAAKEALGRAIELNSNNADAWSNLGDVLSNLRDFDGARGAYQQAILARPGRIEDRVDLIQACLDGGRYPQAENAIDALRVLRPETPEIPFLEGMLAARKADWDTSLAAFDRAVAADENNGNVHLQRSKVLNQLGRDSQAVEALGRAVDLLPESFEAHYNLASLLIGNPATAKSARPYLERAYQLGSPGKTRMILQEEIAKRLEPGANAIWPLLVFDQRRGDHMATLGWVERILSQPDSWASKPDRDARLASVHLAGANAMDALGETERAIAAFKLALGLDPEQVWAWHNLAMAYSKLERWQDCIDASQQALDRIERVQDDLRPAVAQFLQSLVKNSEKALGEFVGPTLNAEDRRDIPGAVPRDQD